ncbi:predicted protein [Histoplasma mississippiense (nom. inval.)]|uniref:predicted protein n=1 Tax=Ajellomyces capsulatus (strain NAm1 / WU24) TaxID=2059318 RepID=UPI000157D52E|nr:predicted protein [Histoplasma mississippiense (nom. inval.)]EDN05291.1 predicted protein [Histoplasma mississippiense (nom. inval.)]
MWFGEARIGKIQQDTGPFVQPRIYSAPEVAFEIPWGAFRGYMKCCYAWFGIYSTEDTYLTTLDEQGHYDPFKHTTQAHGSEDNGKVRFLKFIRSMLSWLPEGQKTAKELLEDSWLNEESV